MAHNSNNPDTRKIIPKTTINQVISHSRAPIRKITARTNLSKPARYIRLPFMKNFHICFIITGLTTRKIPKTIKTMGVCLYAALRPQSGSWSKVNSCGSAALPRWPSARPSAGAGPEGAAARAAIRDEERVVQEERVVSRGCKAQRESFESSARSLKVF